MLPVRYQLLKKALGLIPFLRFVKRICKLCRIFKSKTLILLIKTSINCVKISLRVEIVIVLIVMFLEKFLLDFWLDCNLLLNCKQKDLPKFTFIIEKNERLIG